MTPVLWNGIAALLKLMKNGPFLWHQCGQDPAKKAQEWWMKMEAPAEFKNWLPLFNYLPSTAIHGEWSFDQRLATFTKHSCLQNHLITASRLHNFIFHLHHFREWWNSGIGIKISKINRWQITTLDPKN